MSTLNIGLVFKSYYQIIVMIVQELISHLQLKIAEYRSEQKKARKGKEQLSLCKKVIHSFNDLLRTHIAQELNQYKDAFEEGIIKINDYFESQIQRQKRSYQRQIFDLRSQIQRQYKVISNMRQQVQDLQELIIMQNAKKQNEQQCDGKQKKTNQRHEQKSKEIQKVGTEYGLDVIEEETERTVMSSVKSFHEDNCSHHQTFMRIQQRQNQQSQQSQFLSNKKGSTIKMKDSNQMQRSNSNSQFFRIQQSEQISKISHDRSVYKLEQMIMNQSNASKRQNTYQFSENSDEKYQSMPLTMDYLTKEFKQQQVNDGHLWEERHAVNQLREITNQNNCCSEEDDRQSKTKMFLQQFRKTFNKCLSSANISRKQSTKTDKGSRKSRSRQQKKKTSRQKGHCTATKPQSDKVDSHKFLNDVLKDSYNDNKFSVGNRRTELKYDGQRKGNAKHGNGTLFYSNGLCYEGQFKNNMRHGYGVLRFNQIQIFRGEWQDDELSGQGKIRNFAVINKSKTNSNNSPLIKWVSYCGYFKNNRFEGQGTLYLQGAQKFLGKFICGSACGEGTLYKKNGQIETGIWRNNQLAEQF